MQWLTRILNSFVGWLLRRGLVRIHGHVVWKIREVEGGFWMGECEELNLTVSADTLYGLMDDIGPTMNAMLTELHRTGELQAFLVDRGLSAPDPIETTPATFELPFSTVVRHDSAPALAI